jgi:hypothetical protein
VAHEPSRASLGYAEDLGDGDCQLIFGSDWRDEPSFQEKIDETLVIFVDRTVEMQPRVSIFRRPRTDGKVDLLKAEIVGGKLPLPLDVKEAFIPSRGNRFSDEREAFRRRDRIHMTDVAYDSSQKHSEEFLLDRLCRVLDDFHDATAGLREDESIEFFAYPRQSLDGDQIEVLEDEFEKLQLRQDVRHATEKWSVWWNVPGRFRRDVTHAVGRPIIILSVESHTNTTTESGGGGVGGGL